MENCTLNFVVPKHNSTAANFTISANGNYFNIWRLSTDDLLTGRVSWNSKPKRMELIATTEVSPGMAVDLSNFACPSGSLHTFEVTCSTTPCFIDGNWRIEPRM